MARTLPLAGYVVIAGPAAVAAYGALKPVAARTGLTRSRMIDGRQVPPIAATIPIRQIGMSWKL